MTPEQEIRAKALDLKLNNTTRLAAACMSANRSFNGTKMWADGDLEEFVEYIKDGKKPQKEAVQ